MKIKNILLAAMLSLAGQGIGHAAGGPMNQDLTGLSTLSQKAVDAGKQGNAEEFNKNAEDVLAQAKAATPSASTQRIIGKMKTAVALGKSGKLAEGVAAVEEAMTDMTKSGPPKFGGGN